MPGDITPDGKWLAFIEEDLDTPSVGTVMVMPLDGSAKPRPVTPRDLGAGLTVRFSPDGARLLFADGRLSERGALWTVNPDGSGLHLVWDDGTRFGSHPSWSPDGSQIIFSLNDIADDYEHRPNALAVIDADGTNLREIVRDGDFRREATWLRSSATR